MLSPRAGDEREARLSKECNSIIACEAEGEAMAGCSSKNRLIVNRDSIASGSCTVPSCLGRSIN